MLTKLGTGSCLVVGMILPALPASAGTENCSRGYACGWDSLTYEGTSFGSTYTEGWWSPFLNRASSVAANGTTCKSTRFYKSWNHMTGHVYGDYFTLHSKTLVGSNFRDPDLRNGAGDRTGETGWDNTIEATKFVLCQ